MSDLSLLTAHAPVDAPEEPLAARAGSSSEDESSAAAHSASATRPLTVSHRSEVRPHPRVVALSLNLVPPLGGPRARPAHDWDSPTALAPWCPQLRADGEKAWRELQRGNELFSAGGPEFLDRIMVHTRTDRREMVLRQQPIATVLACADSRASPSLLFACGQGDLFIIRNAGNVVGETAMATIEFGLVVLKTPLLIVMAHKKCGAIRASMSELEGDAAALPHHVGRFVRHLKEPVVWACSHCARTKGEEGYEDEVWELAIQENARRSLRTILRESDAVRRLVESKAVKVVLAEYDILTGHVEELPIDTSELDSDEEAERAGAGGGRGGGAAPAGSESPQVISIRRNTMHFSFLSSDDHFTIASADDP